MDSLIEKNIAEGKAAFEDLHTLADPVLFPIIGRAFHHFSEVASSTYEKDLLSDMPVLQKFLDHNLQELLANFFKKLGDDILWTFNKDEKNLEVKHWEKVLTILPDVLKVVACFKFKGFVNVEFSPKGLLIKGDIYNGQSIKDHRVNIYRVFRNLLAKQALLTFEVKEQSGTFETELSLWADISHDPSVVRAYDFFPDYDQEQGTLIAFSSILNNYKISLEEFESLGEHLTIEITPQLQVIKREKLPDNFKTEFTSSEIIHFHFLFRPISLIIGCKGKNIPQYALGGTGRGLLETSQKVGKIFDIFSLLSL